MNNVKRLRKVFFLFVWMIQITKCQYFLIVLFKPVDIIKRSILLIFVGCQVYLNQYLLLYTLLVVYRIFFLILNFVTRIKGSLWKESTIMKNQTCTTKKQLLAIPFIKKQHPTFALLPEKGKNGICGTRRIFLSPALKVQSKPSYYVCHLSIPFGKNAALVGYFVCTILHDYTLFCN